MNINRTLVLALLLSAAAVQAPAHAINGKLPAPQINPAVNAPSIKVVTPTVRPLQLPAVQTDNEVVDPDMADDLREDRGLLPDGGRVDRLRELPAVHPLQLPAVQTDNEVVDPDMADDLREDRGLLPDGGRSDQLRELPAGSDRIAEVNGEDWNLIRELSDLLGFGNDGLFDDSGNTDDDPFGFGPGGADDIAGGPVDPSAGLGQERAEDSHPGSGGVDHAAYFVEGLPWNQSNGSAQQTPGSRTDFGGFTNPSGAVQDQNGHASQGRSGMTVRRYDQRYIPKDRTRTYIRTSPGGTTTIREVRRDAYGVTTGETQTVIDRPDEEGWRTYTEYKRYSHGDELEVANGVIYDPDGDGVPDDPGNSGGGPAGQPLPDGGSTWGSNVTYCDLRDCDGGQRSNPTDMLTQPGSGGEDDASTAGPRQAVSVAFRQDIVTNTGDSSVDFSGPDHTGSGQASEFDPCITAGGCGDDNPEY